MNSGGRGGGDETSPGPFWKHSWWDLLEDRTWAVRNRGQGWPPRLQAGRIRRMGSPFPETGGGTGLRTKIRNLL